MSAAVDRAVALGAQQVLEQHLQRERQPRDVEALLQRVQAEDLVARARRPRACPWRQSCSPTSASPGRSRVRVCGAIGAQSRRVASGERGAPGARARRSARAAAAARVTRPLPWRLERSSAASHASSSSSVPIGACHWATPIEAETPGRRRVLRQASPAAARAPGRGRRGGAVEVGVGQDHDELVAAVAGDAVERAELAHQRLHDLAQHRVAGLVAVAVVDELEVVEVDQQARQRRCRCASARPISSSRRRRIARWFMQPVTASVPASARARTSASAVAAWSTSALASSTRAASKRPGDAPHEHHDRLDLAALGERQQQRAADRAGRRQPRHARGELLARRRPGSCGRCCATQLTPGGRSARGSR